MGRVTVICFCLLCAWALSQQAADAHQPYIVKAGSCPVRVEDPEVSKAFYGRLDSAPQFFVVASDRALTLYVNLLVPRIKDVDKKVWAKIVNSKKEVVAELDGAKADWREFHEPFSGTDYYRGPEFRKQLPADTYTIEVSSPDQRGKYVLAVGEKEVFSLAEVFRSMRIVSQLKSEFFTDAPPQTVTVEPGPSSTSGSRLPQRRPSDPCTAQ
jgi:hypothetical protein